MIAGQLLEPQAMSLQTMPTDADQRTNRADDAHALEEDAHLRNDTYITSTRPWADGPGAAAHRQIEDCPGPPLQGAPARCIELFKYRAREISKQCTCGNLMT